METIDLRIGIKFCELLRESMRMDHEGTEHVSVAPRLSLKAVLSQSAGEQGKKYTMSQEPVDEQHMFPRWAGVEHGAPGVRAGGWRGMVPILVGAAGGPDSNRADRHHGSLASVQSQSVRWSRKPVPSRVHESS